MLHSKRLTLPSDQSTVELTSGFDTDQEYVIVLRRSSGSFFIGDASLTWGSGFGVGSANPEITLRLQREPLYAAATDTNNSCTVDVLAYSA